MQRLDALIAVSSMFEGDACAQLPGGKGGKRVGFTRLLQPASILVANESTHTEGL